MGFLHNDPVYSLAILYCFTIIPDYWKNSTIKIKKMSDFLQIFPAFFPAGQIKKKLAFPSCKLRKSVIKWISLLEITTVLEAFMRFPFPP